MIDKLVTCATGSDIKTLAFALPFIKKYLAPVLIYVAVPDQEVERACDLLLNASNGVNIQVVPDSKIITVKESDIIKKSLKEKGHLDKYGWYLQQFIKIKASSTSEAMQRVLIWDSDTVPFRPIKFFNDERSVNYFVSQEYHEPYFETLTSLLDICKQTPNSFIAQCLPLTSGVASAFINSLGGNDRWVEYVMGNLSDKSPFAFSEYEFIGNYIMKEKLLDVNFIYAPWVREGREYYYKFGSLELATKHLSNKYCFSAFEKIGQNRTRYYLGYFFRRLKSLLFFNRA